MRIEVPGPGDHWIELRDLDTLTGGDEEAYARILTKAWERRSEEEVNAPAGSERVPLRLPAGWIQKREDDLATRLITGWSFDKPESVPQITLPYSAEARQLLPFRALKALRATLKLYISEFEETPGPKEPEPPASTTDGSGSDSG